MKRTNLLTLWKRNRKSNTPFIGTSDFMATLPFMAEYLDNYKRIDRDFIVTRGYFVPLWNLNYEDDDDGVLLQFKEDVNNLLFRNKDNYQHMYDVLKMEYNPIENYNRKEVIKDITDTSNKTTNDFGERNEHYNYGEAGTTDVLGEQVTTDKHGAQNITENMGASKITENNGASKVTNTVGAINVTDTIGAYSDNSSIGAQSNVHKVSGSNNGLVAGEGDDIGARSDSVSHTSHTDQHNTGSHTDTSTTDAVTNITNSDAVKNTTEAAEYVNTTANGSQTNTHTEKAKNDSHVTDARQDVSSLSGTVIYDHTNETKGNIGVTTSQQMIEQEMQLRATYNLYTIIYEDIIKNLCTYCDKGIDAFYAGLQDMEDDMEIKAGNVTLKVEQVADGAIITATDDTGTTKAKIDNGITPRFKVESDGDIFVDYSKGDE